MYNSNTSLKDSFKHYAQIIEGALDQVVQDLLMEYCKMKKPLHRGFLSYAYR